MNTDVQPQVISFKTDEKTHFDRARNIRDLVFIQEQKVDEKDEFDEYEDESLHYLVLVDDKAVGTARWRHIGDEVKLERFAMLKEYRGLKIGDKLLQTVINDVKDLGKEVYLHAQLKAIPFYKRRGFQKVGDLFLECDIEHYEMRLKSEAFER